MFKTLLKSPHLLLILIANFALVGCGDQSQNSAEQAADQTQEAAEETANQAEEAATEETEENTTQN